MNSDLLPQISVCLPVNELERWSPASLSFIGDAVQTLYDRTLLSANSGAKPGALQRAVSKRVSAVGQAEAYHKIAPHLTEAETAVLKRCRNAHTATVSKNAPVGDYRLASGWEGLIGYLYLSGQHERLKEIFDLGYPNEK